MVEDDFAAHLVDRQGQRAALERRLGVEQGKDALGRSHGPLIEIKGAAQTGQRPEQALSHEDEDAVGADLQYDSVDEVIKAVKEYADANPDEELVRGFGWRYALFPPTGPTKELLDEIVPDRPVFLFAIDAHGGWANSKALEMAALISMSLDSLGTTSRSHSGSGVSRLAVIGAIE